MWRACSGDLAVSPDQAASVVPKGYLSLGGILGGVSKPAPYGYARWKRSARRRYSPLTKGRGPMSHLKVVGIHPGWARADEDLAVQRPTWVGGGKKDLFWRPLSAITDP